MLCFMLLMSLYGHAAGNPMNPRVEHPKYDNYRNIPGVTRAEIEAIEVLKVSHPRIYYGVSESTETFYTIDGSIGGYTVCFANG